MRFERKYRFDASRQYALSLLEQIQLGRLCEVAARLDQRLAIPATSSNFSLRSSSDAFLVSRSGKHKRALTASDFLLVDLAGKSKAAVAPKASDETLLHALIYKACPWIRCVLHCHAPELETLRPPAIQMPGHELLKALGMDDHETSYTLAVFENNQDMKILAAEIQEREFNARAQTQGPILFVLSRHGIYCGGETVDRAEAYLESVLHLLKHDHFTQVASHAGTK